MSYKKNITWVIAFSIAMGFLESAVVIYLRELMYPTGFTFPLRPIHHNLAQVELWREFATIVMLVAIGILVGRNKAEKLAYFIMSFAVWDIFYYVFLYLFLGWPQSLFTWDILFLIPVPWVGPVITPVIVSLTMILFAFTIIRFTEKGRDVLLSMWEKLGLIIGSLVCIGAFIEDYVVQNHALLYRNLNRNSSLLSELGKYIPIHFDWNLFAIGEGILLWVYFVYVRRLRNIGVIGLIK